MRVNMKRFLMITTAFLIVLGLSACGPTECARGELLLDDECISTDTMLSYTGVEDIYYTIGDDAPDYLDGISVEDIVDGDVSADITVDSSLVDLETPGTYTVTLTVSNSNSISKVVTFDVVVEEAPNLERDNAKLDIAELHVQDGISESIPSDGLTLPSFGSNGTFFYWSTSDARVITKTGWVIPPHVGLGDQTVTLTCRAVNGAYSETLTYEVRVRANDEVSVTSKVTMPFEGTSDEYVVDDQAAVEIFYVDNGAVPYIDVETFVNMIDGALESSIIEFTPIDDDKLEVSYEVEYEDFDGSTVVEEYTALIDFTENTFTVNNFDFFESYVASTESDYGEGLDYVDAYYRDGEEVTIDLGNYDFDILIYDDGGELEYLMPFHVTNLLFAGGVYYDVYYNGDKLWGIDTFGISGGGEEADAIIEEARTSSLNAASAPDDVKHATYNFLALALDYFYGLKEERRVDTYYDILALRNEDIMDSSDNELYNFMYNFAYDLDDLHTSYQFFGQYYDDPTGSRGASISDMGTRVTKFYNGLWDVQDLLDAKYGTHAEDELPTMRLIDDGKTAVIYLYGFTIDSPDDFKATVRSLPSSVENVVVDLTYNTGGNIGAVLRIFGYITEEQMMYHSQNPADGSAVTYYIESDYNAYDEYNWYINTSSVTFSAANMMAAMAKELGIPVMGQNSSGGASSIGVIIAPDGSCLMISTNNVLSTRSGDSEATYEYDSVEGGVKVDYKLSDVTSDAQIIAAIAEHQADQAEE